MINHILKTNQFEPILLNKAQGSWVWDVDGKKYLDCESGMWCVNLGHNHPKVIRVLKKQLDQIMHRNKGFLTPIAIEAAEQLLEFFPHEYDKLTFLNSGSEAIEFGINFAKKATKRRKVLSLQDSYLGAYGAAKESSYTTSEESKFKIAYPIYNSEECSCLEIYQPIIDDIFLNYSSDIACFVLEPIMVSGGVFKPCKAFIQYICEKTHDSGGLVIIDEVTTGMGRTGNKFGYEMYNIIPDVVILGKALGNGYPISAIITNSSLESKIPSGELYYAQSHQLDPLGAAVVKSVVNVFHEENIIERSKNKIQKLNDIFQKFDHPFIKEIRSHGMIFGIQIQPYKEMSSEDVILKLKNLLLDAGLIVGYNLSREFIRLLPPLNIKDSEIEILKSAIFQNFALI